MFVYERNIPKYCPMKFIFKTLINHLKNMILWIMFLRAIMF